MKINMNNLFDANSIEIKEDVSNIDTVLEYEQILLSISKTIMNYRTTHKLTQEELAKDLNVNQVMISKLERGRYNPTVKLLYNISRKLTNSSDLFIDTLKDIITNLYKTKNFHHNKTLPSTNLQDLKVWHCQNKYIKKGVAQFLQ